MRRFGLAVLLVLLLTLPLLSAEKTYGNVTLRPADVVRVYDGDTITVNIPSFPPIIGREISVRIYGVDTPEMKGGTVREKELAVKARVLVVGRISKAKQIELRNLRRDKYFRILAEVYVDGENITDILIRENLGRTYWGGTKQPW
ncbi:MAG: thermonuclease family protein [Candidatus Ratteibacteria bacterium]|jgi:endonuclease YncB( thermonuclease family)